MQYYTIATEIGTAAASNAFLTGTKVNITTFVVGDGGGIEYAPTPDMTELRNEVWRGVVSNAEIDPDSPNVINYTALLPSTVGGFVMREMGIMDDQGRLIGIGNMASTPKIRFDQGISDEIELTFSLTISSPEAMEWKVDPTVILATKADIAAHNLSVESHPDIRDELSDINTQLSNKAALEEFKTLQSDYYAGAVITAFSSPRQLPHAGLYHIAAMTAEVNAHLDDAAHSMTDYNAGDFYAQLLTSFGAEHGGCTFGTLIVTSPRLAKKVWVARIWEYEIKEWVLLAHASAPQRFDLTLHNELLGRAKYSKDQFGMVWLDFNIYKSETEDHISHNILVGYLPEGFRPKDNTLIPVWAGKGEGDNTKMMGNLILYPSGEIWFYVGYGIEVRSFAAQCGFYI